MKMLAELIRTVEKLGGNPEKIKIEDDMFWDVIEKAVNSTKNIKPNSKQVEKRL